MTDPQDNADATTHRPDAHPLLDPAALRPDTLAVRGGLNRSNFDETSEGLFLTQGYVYPRAADAEAAFAGELDRFVYSRYGNPTVGMFEERLRLLEGDAQRRWRPTHQTTPAPSSGDSTRNGQSR